MSSDACMPWASFLADSTNHSPGVWTHLPVLSASFHSETVQRLPMSLSKVSAMGGGASAAFRGGFAWVRGSGHGRRRASVATWGFRIRCTCSRRWCAWVHQCCGLAASPSARAGPETELTLKKDLGRGRRQRKRSNESSCDHFVYVGQRRRRKTVQQRRLRGDTWSLSHRGARRKRVGGGRAPRVQNHERPATRRKSAPIGADLTKPA